MKHKFTRAEAANFIKRQPSGVNFAVHLRCDVPLADNDDQCFPDAGCGYVRLSRKEAVRIAANFISETIEGRGGRVPVAVHDGYGSVTVWIG